MKRKHFKKGMEMSIIKYLFAMVAGAFILVFFFSFAMKHKGVSTTLEANEFIFSFDDALTAFSASADSTKEFIFSKPANVNFAEGRISTPGSVAKPTEKIVFMRENLTGKNFLAWTKRWKFPFSVENFFYLTNIAKVKMYLVYDSASSDFVKDLVEGGDYIPARFDVDKIDYNVLKQSKTIAELKKMVGSKEEIRFVFFSNPGKLVNSLPSALGSRAYLVKVEPRDSGKAVFITDNNEEAIYLGKDMLWGVVFSGSYDSYVFNAVRALDKLSEMCDLYVRKIDFLGAKAPADCKNSYNGIRSNLAGLGSLALTHELKDHARYVEFRDGLKQNIDDLGSECPEVF